MAVFIYIEVTGISNSSAREVIKWSFMVPRRAEERIMAS
jgi:hypothetical protein